MRRVLVSGLIALLAFSVACTNKKVNNPLANVGSKQPDKVLFDRSMDAMKHNKFDVARMTLQTLINTYPDSEFIARAKLAVADSWYAEGGSTALQQAEIEYKDFGTFFPNMPEAAEAALKVANIHYQQMEKADRDYTHAMRAEEEYRSVILQYPDNKVIAKEARQRLREVQEVLAQREYNIGRFYYLRQAYPAAIARLQTLVDRYPLYSGADEALFLLGQTYEAEIAMLRANSKVAEGPKSRMIEEFEKNAAAAYGKIITRYPAMDRALDAKARLEALKQPVPRPTRAAMELNKKEVASRREPSMMSNVMGPFSKHPDMARATQLGEPSMTDPTPVNATDVVKAATSAMGGGKGADAQVSGQIVKVAPGPNQEAPRSDAPPAAVPDPAANGTDPAAVAAAPPATDPPAAGQQAPAAGELTPNVAADPNELKPNTPADPTALPPLQQNNELANGGAADSASSSSSSQKQDELVDISSSKKKKKKGMAKLNPF
ncbi:MAG: outer membrane protein assembly factor BamD [Acidobacteria bacterium]|nr:MAG: outer membrane protein assembly factor BamD [Acidobacteriota bacterium]